MASIFVPVLYLAIIVGGLGIFSYFYRKRAANRKVESFFPTHHERNTYVTLLQKTNPPTADALLKAALIRRAIEDVRRAVRIREDKPALQNLIQKGAVGDDLWNSMLAAEKELEAEVLEVMHEANSFAPGWGQIIFTSAGEMVQNEKMTKQYMDIPKLRAEMEKKYPSKKRKTIQPALSTPVKSERPSSPAPTTTKPELSEDHGSLSPPASSNGTLVPPAPSTDAESAASMSDVEVISSPGSPSSQSPKSPSSAKKSAKKGKKRK